MKILNVWVQVVCVVLPLALTGCKSSDALYSRDATLQSQGNSYLAEWEKSNASIVDPDLKKLGEGRRSELQATLAEVAKPMNALRASLDPFLTSAEDLQKYLASDLTPASIDAVAGKAGKCSKEARSLEGLFEKLDSALAKAAPKFKVAKPPPPAAK